MGPFYSQENLPLINQFRFQGDIAMSLDFESNVMPRIQFLIDLGIRAQDIGEIFTINPTFFMVDLGEWRGLKQRMQSFYMLSQMEDSWPQFYFSIGNNRYIKCF